MRRWLAESARHDHVLIAAFLAQGALLEKALGVIEALGEEVTRTSFVGLTLKELRDRAYRHALYDAHGNISEAARALGVARETLQRFKESHAYSPRRPRLRAAPRLVRPARRRTGTE